MEKYILPSPVLSGTDIICFSHLRWNFVYQRPQHLLSRFARYTRVFFIEEPIFEENAERLHLDGHSPNIWVVTPHLDPRLEGEALDKKQKDMVDLLFSIMNIQKHISWHYTPMSLTFSKHLEPELTVYDCMDELSAFRFAPPLLKQLEEEMMERADLVFTGGQSLYEAKKHRHQHIYAFPSSIDEEHFSTARSIATEPLDQAHISHPRLGFAGVIDERMDLELLEQVATARPDWHLVMIGPVVKIDPATLPQLPNIHYLGSRKYNDLPAYMAGWDAAIMPFALNESTRYISPTKTPEYLAAGKPVISTRINDVIEPYGNMGLVYVAGDAQEFTSLAERAMNSAAPQWLQKVDAFLATMSWDRTWNNMLTHMAHMLITKPMLLQPDTALGSAKLAQMNNVEEVEHRPLARRYS